MMLSVRRATVKDIDEIQRVASRSWHATHAPLLGAETAETFFDAEYTEARVRSKVTSDTSVFEVAADVGGIVGFVAATPMGADSRTYGLSWLYVHPVRWREGIGTRLLSRAERTIERRGGDRIRLGVIAANDRALRFYEAAGYTHRDDYYDDRIEARGCLYVKELKREGSCRLNHDSGRLQEG